MKMGEGTKKVLKELEVDELEELERSLNFAAMKIRFWGKRNNFREELRLKEITRKKMNEIRKEIKEMKRLKIKLKSFKLLSDLNIEKGVEIEKIMKIEIKLEKLKIPTTMINTIKKSVISEKYMHHISSQRIYCV